MASVMFLCLVLMSSVCFGHSSDRIIDMECQSAVGVIGETTHIICSFNTEDKDITIYVLVLLKGNSKSLTYRDQKTEGDHRFNFSASNNPSILLSNTSISDEAEYTYSVITDRGIIQNKTFSITVTAKFNSPVMSSSPEKIIAGQKVDLYCKSSGGYPAGSIRWFDQTGTDWTANSEQERTLGQDQLFELSSKLSFTSIDTLLAPFKCRVFNSKGHEEGQSTFHMKITGATPTNPETRNVVAAVVVIGSLIVGLLVVLLLRRRRTRRYENKGATEEGATEVCQRNNFL